MLRDPSTVVRRHERPEGVGANGVEVSTDEMLEAVQAPSPNRRWHRITRVMRRQVRKGRSDSQGEGHVAEPKLRSLTIKVAAAASTLCGGRHYGRG